MHILPELQKELEDIYIQRLLSMRQLKKDPVHKKIMHANYALFVSINSRVDHLKYYVTRSLI